MPTKLDALSLMLMHRMLMGDLIRDNLPPSHKLYLIIMYMPEVY